MQRGQCVVVDVDAQPRCRRNRHRPVDERQHTGRDDVLALPRPVRVTRIGQVRGGRGQVHHRGQADAQMRIGVHRQPQPECFADAGQQPRPLQATPVVVIGQHHTHRTLGDRGGQFVERDDAHVRGQRHRCLRGHLGHPVQARGGVLQVLEDAGQAGGDLHRGLRRPGGVGVQAQRHAGERGGQRLDRRHLLLRCEHPALEFDCGETIFGDDASGLGDDAVRVERRSERVGFGTGMGGPLVEQVRAERNGITHRAAEQIRHRPSERAALHVQAGHLERGEHLVHGTGRGDHAGGAHGRGVAAQRVGDRHTYRVEREHIQTGDCVGGGPQPGQVPGVGVGLAQADEARVGVQLDDGAQCVRLVHTDGVE